MMNKVQQHVNSVRESKKRKTTEESCSRGSKQPLIYAKLTSISQSPEHPRVKQQDVDKAVAEFIVQGIHPLATVEQPAFVSLLLSKFS